MPFVVLAVGLVVAVVVPFFWASPLPVFVGAALVLAGGLWSRRRAVVVPAVVLAAALVAAPAVITGYRDGQGIAWTVPQDESLRLAQDGLAVTRVQDEPILRGRDLRTGDRTWELRLPDTDEALRLWRIGPRLLTTGFDDTLRAVDVAGGKVQWESPGGVMFLGVSDGEHVAVTRCGTSSAECEVQSLSLEDGTVAWRAPADGDARYLGVPLPDDGAPQRDIAAWPASFVLLGDDERWAARDLATGRELATGSRRDGSTTLLGDVLVRSRDDGALTATNVQTGAQAWTRPAGDGRASLSPIVSHDTLALPAGQLVLSGDGYAIDSVRLGDRLRLLDARTGKLDEQPIDVDFDLVDVLSAGLEGAPAVLWRDYDGDGIASRVIDDGTVYDRDGVRGAHLTPRLVGFESDGHTWGSADDRVIEVFDRRSGDRVVRHTGGDAALFSYGDALVIVEGDDEDDAVQRVVTPG